MVMQIKRRIGTAGAPPNLAEGQLGYNDEVPATVMGDDRLFIGSDNAGTATVKQLLGPERQLELAGAQTITGNKTIAIANLHVTGATAANMLLTSAAGFATGALQWTTAPGGGLMTVATDSTLDGDGTGTDPLSVLHLATARDITIQTRAVQPDGSITTINISPASFDGSAAGTMTNFAITRLDDGTW